MIPIKYKKLLKLKKGDLNLTEWGVLIQGQVRIQLKKLRKLYIQLLPISLRLKVQKEIFMLIQIKNCRTMTIQSL